MCTPQGFLQLRAAHPAVTGAQGARVPAYTRASRDDRARTPGRAVKVFEPGRGPRRGGDQPAFRLVPSRDAAWAGVLFVTVKALH